MLSAIVAQVDAVLRSARPGQAGLDRARSSSSSSVNSGSGVLVGAEQALFLGVALDQVDQRRRRGPVRRR